MKKLYGTGVSRKDGPGSLLRSLSRELTPKEIEIVTGGDDLPGDDHEFDGTLIAHDDDTGKGRDEA